MCISVREVLIWIREKEFPTISSGIKVHSNTAKTQLVVKYIYLYLSFPRRSYYTMQQQHVKFPQKNENLSQKRPFIEK